MRSPRPTCRGGDIAIRALPMDFAASQILGPPGNVGVTAIPSWSDG